MSNRHVTELSRVCEHLLLDAAQALPALSEEFKRDLEHLRRLIAARGVHLFTVDLPAVSKHLDRCLDAGQYVPSYLPTTRPVSRTVVIPKLFRGLYLLIFDEHGSLKADPSTQAVFFLRQLLAFGKKTELDCSSRAKIDEVFDFLECDYALPRPFGIWESDSPGDWNQVFRKFTDNFGYPTPTDPSVARFLEYADIISGILTSSLGPYQPSDYRFRHGPGAISEVTGPSNKYCWRNWSERLESVFPVADYGFHNFSSWASGIAERKIASNEAFSRLICVPKTYSKPRLIAAEPSEHQWCQQNIWHYFCEKTQSSWIGDFVRFRDQSLNQDLCLQGSRDGSLATLDLSSASDRVTTEVVECVFRGNPSLLKALAASRTRWVKLPENLGFSRYRKLNKFSTMGSAVTFPVESLVFLVISLAAIHCVERCRPSLRTIRALKGRVAIFGDDIVVPKETGQAVKYALEHCMFKVNTQKSYGGSNFRESCGVDAFRGQVVTPVYWKSIQTGRPEAVASTVAVHNNLVSRFLMNTARYIASTLRKESLPYVVPGSGVIGLHARVCPPLKFPSRWNSSLHVVEYRVPTITSRAPKAPTNDDTALFQFFTENPSPHQLWSHGVVQRARLKLRRAWVAEDRFAAQR